MNGVLVINKEKGYTSRDVVNIVGKVLGTKKVGHTGTLDPLATGVLVIPVGKALKISELLTCNDKEYVAKVAIGYETDTLDITGEVTNKRIIDIDKDMVLRVLDRFVGKIKQQVPKYSAVKIRGKKLYEYAREGIEVELPVREVEVKKLELVSDISIVDGYPTFLIKCTVSKGTYIRSLIRDMGYALGSYGTMMELRRTRQGKFDISMAVTMGDMQKGRYKLLDIRDVLDIPIVKVNEKRAFKIRNGMVMEPFFEGDMALITSLDNQIMAIYQNVNGKARVYKMLSS